MPKRTSSELVAVGNVEERIFSIRGHKVMLDEDLAELYGVRTKRLNEQVKRNISRFPTDFMFRLTPEEFQIVIRMRSQIATTSPKRNVRFPPFVFTEHGAVMLASILDSDIAVEASVAVVRAFVRMRAVFSEHRELSRKIEDLERKYAKHDADLGLVFNTLRQLMEPPKPSNKRRIGF